LKLSFDLLAEKKEDRQKVVRKKDEMQTDEDEDDAKVG
jgi:hypothetical protein